jgi:hypothetical protein
MNKLIEDLKRRANIDFNPDQEGLDLFATLIIQECVNAVKEFSVEQSRQNMDEGLYVAMRIVEATWKIKKHFGIEQ